MLRTIPGFEGRYSASDDGRIWSHPKNTNSNRAGRWLRPAMSHGYFRVRIYPACGACTTTNVHRLVALAWHPNPEQLPQINHIDGNKLNNAPGNLEWCSASANVRHAWKHGLARGSERATRAGLANLLAFNRTTRKLTEQQIAEIKRRLAAGETGRALARAFSVSPGTISHINRGHLYKDVQC